ncbi:uncharacterized protein Dmoj_GI25861, partial [Drosophila mojavensis]
MKKLRNYGAVPSVDDETMDYIVEVLPTHIHEMHVRAPVEFDGSVPNFTEEELNIAALSLKNKKAPGPDNIPAEILKDLYSTQTGTKRYRVTGVAAQGSILGPDLWNISYDDILRLEMPEDTFLIGYADDIAEVITARNTVEAQKRLTQVMIRTQTWLNSRGLELATHKTELLLFTRKQIPTEIEMR